MKDTSKAVFLDRDGTISREVGYIDNVEDFELYPDAAEALACLQSRGYALIVVTNQSGVARGYFPESRVRAINDRMVELLARAGATIDGVYYCPHLEEGTVPAYAVRCSCRKPATGMITQAASEHGIVLPASVMVGDSLSDVECGKNAGLTTVLVRTGYGKNYEPVISGLPDREKPDYIADTLRDAASWIVQRTEDEHNAL